jgi:hypothetical protein
MRSRPSRTNRNGRSSRCRSSSASRLGPGQGAHLVLAPPADVAERTGQEILERRVGFVEAPPEPAGERLHFLRRDLPEPLPGERALAHAANGDEAENARAECFRVGIGDPVRQQIELGLAPDEVAHLH